MKKGTALQLNNISIYPTQKDDLLEIFEISSLSFPISWSMDSIKQELINPAARYVTAKFDKKVVGYGGLWAVIGEGQITNIAVHPDFRKCGIGSMIVKSLIDICKNENLSSLTLEVRKSNIAAQNLYKKFGFASEGVRKHYYEDNKEDAIIMWKRNI